ncbi:MAG: filamentous hemagglutinin N-terminal domain-containing protein [Cyanobacteria bacterium P01_G01_bin.19]
MNPVLLFLTSLSVLFVTSSIQAQVVEDGSLSTEVNSDNNRDFTVDAGETRGSNLFHSFAEFSVPNNGSVYFNNGLSIQNIISRVTGSSVSNINGLIRSNGSANLFLLNPNGIIFGENARLNIGGSFIGTTAESLVFEDGSEFNAIADDSTSALLTVSVPLGLQLGSNPGEIINRANPLDPTGQDQSQIGLTTTESQTLALLGRNIVFDGGAVTAPDGNIELGSVGADSYVGLESTTEGWNLNYDNVAEFDNIQLDNLASVDSSGMGGGDINLSGENIQILNGSAITSNTVGDRDGGKIEIRASDTLEINGSDRTGTKEDLLLSRFEIFLPFASQIASNIFGSGKSSDIEIFTHDLNVIDGGSIELLSFSPTTSNSGDLSIFATGTINLAGIRPLLGVGENAEAIIQAGTPSVSLDESIEFNQASGFTNSPVAEGSGGDINIIANRLRVEDGSGIGTSPFGTGDAGDISINARESVELIGTSPRSNSVGSVITTNTFSQGNAGNIEIETGRLSLLAGGIVVSTTSIVNGGNAGNIAIDSEITEISGFSGSDRKSSAISSQTNNESMGGDILIDTDILTISDRGILNIQGTSTGSPGNLQVNANSVSLSNNARITAENAAAFEGGNISLNILENLTLAENSSISALALGDANGGNLDITVNFLVAEPNENSDILATAVNGDGGNITITGEGIFGITRGASKPPNQTNDIDASSEFGLDGMVNFNFPELKDSNFENTNFFKAITTQNLLSSDVCKVSLASEYYIIGKGGIAFSPDRDLNTSDGWSDFRFFEDETAQTQASVAEKKRSEVKKVEMIRGWFKDSQGQMVLTAKPLAATSNSSPLPHPSCSYPNKS